MDDLIRRKATGTPEEFGMRLGIGKTALMEDLKELKELGAEVMYCRTRQSYYYGNAFEVKIGHIKSKEQLKIKGGQMTTSYPFCAGNIRNNGLYFVLQTVEV